MLNQAGKPVEVFTPITGERLLEADISRIKFWGVFCLKCRRPHIVEAGVQGFKCKASNCQTYNQVQLKRRHITDRVSGFFENFNEAKEWLDKMTEAWAIMEIEREELEGKYKINYFGIKPKL
jgi:hypothetical protein